jgi:hypothetical protein
VRPFAGILPLLLVTLTLAGCELLELPDVRPGTDGALPYPAGCSDYGLSARRCDAIVAWAEEQLPAAHRPVTAIELAPDPEPEAVRLGGSFTALVRFRMEDGSALDFPLYCGIGGQWSLLCTDTPEIRISSPTMGGYTDVPCAGEAPNGCATPLPTLQPAAVAASRPLEIAARDIPIDHIGRYEVPLGRAVLPNGVLTEASFGLRDLKTQALAVRDAVWLDVRPIDPDAPPFDNYYVRGWHKGTETVGVVVMFDVVSFEPGATLELRDIVVR